MGCDKIVGSLMPYVANGENGLSRRLSGSCRSIVESTKNLIDKTSSYLGRRISPATEEKIMLRLFYGGTATGALVTLSAFYVAIQAILTPEILNSYKDLLIGESAISLPQYLSSAALMLHLGSRK
jgi:hypothetical protein